LSKPAQQNDPRTCFHMNNFRRARALSAVARWTTNPRRGTRQGIRKRDCRSLAPRSRTVRWVTASCIITQKRLSATDISALASMKNVAKCDTWCELQNPVNHRVFERKLRPKPSGRGHVCLGVTHRVAPPPTRRAGADGGLPCPDQGCGWPKCESPTKDVTASGGRTQRAYRRAVLLCLWTNDPDEPARLSDRDPRSGGITR
jgi:hypothetical protein